LQAAFFGTFFMHDTGGRKRPAVHSEQGSSPEKEEATLLFFSSYFF